MSRAGGWYRDSRRHSLAARGVKTAGLQRDYGGYHPKLSVDYSDIEIAKHNMDIEELDALLEGVRSDKMFIVPGPWQDDLMYEVLLLERERGLHLEARYLHLGWARNKASVPSYQYHANSRARVMQDISERLTQKEKEIEEVQAKLWELEKKRTQGISRR